MAREKERGSTGVIDTLTAGYGTVNRHPWIIGVPVLVDLFFWLGPRLSLAPLLQGTVGRIALPVGMSGDMLQSFQDSREWLLRAGDSFNLFSLLATNIPGIPSLMAGRDGLGVSFALDSPWIALLMFLLLPIAGIWLASIYYVVVGRPVRGIDESAGTIWSRIWRTWGRLVAFLLLAIGVGLLIGVSIMVVGVVASAVNSSLLGFIAAFAWVTALWVQFYLFFVVDAMVISDVGPLQAIRNSITVVRFNMGSAMGLVVLIWIITLGMPIVWDAMAQNLVGTIAAILGNAYISAGLAVASMTFYRDRFLAVNDRLVGIRNPAKD